MYRNNGGELNYASSYGTRISQIRVPLPGTPPYPIRFSAGQITGICAPCRWSLEQAVLNLRGGQTINLLSPPCSAPEGAE